MAELWDVLDENGNKIGRLHERGKPMKAGEGHLVVQIWIMNSKREFLISKRSLGVGWWDGMWHTTGGCAIAGDDSLSATLRETKEELGVAINPKNGKLFKQYSEPRISDDGFVALHVWIFRQEVDIESVTFQPDEICDVMWADKEQIRKMIDEGIFIPPEEAYPYIDELFDFCETI